MNPDLFYAQNPWLRGRPVEEKGLVARRFEIPRLSHGPVPVALVIGPRRCGKTTWMYQRIARTLARHEVDPRRVLLFNLDDVELRRALDRNPDGLLDLVRRFTGLDLPSDPGPFHLYLDEVQKHPRTIERVKIYHDLWKNRVFFTLSGSSGLDLLREAGESLAGRVHIARMYPFSMAEILDHRGIPHGPDFLLRDLMQQNVDMRVLEEAERQMLPFFSEVKTAFERALVFGLMPEAFLAQGGEITWLHDFRRTYLERDIRSLANVGNLEAFSAVLDSATASTGGLLDRTRISRETGVALSTVRKYLSILQETFVLDLIPPFSRSLRARVTRSPRLYPFDPGLLTLQTGVADLGVLERTGLVGRHVETLALAELRKACATLLPEVRVHHWRTPGGAEVDFILEHAGRLLPVEVRAASSPESVRTANLRRFLHDHGIDRGLVLYTGPVAEAGDILFLPLWMLR